MKSTSNSKGSSINKVSRAGKGQSINQVQDYQNQRIKERSKNTKMGYMQISIRKTMGSRRLHIWPMCFIFSTNRMWMYHLKKSSGI